MADNKQGASQASQMNELPRLRRLSDDRTHTLNELNIIGRHVDCDLFIDDEKGVSRKHARLTVEDGVVHVEDLGSLNGTLVNGQDSEGKQALANGDILIFDEQEYELFVPYDDCNDFDPAMTVIANRSAIKHRIQKKREKKEQQKEQQSVETSQPVSSKVDSAFSHQRSANHTIIDQPRKSVAPSMRIVDEEFLREVHDDVAGSSSVDMLDVTLDDVPLDDAAHVEAAPDKPDETLSVPEQSTPAGAVREAFDVSDDEVVEILHSEAPGGAPTQFVPDERGTRSDSGRVGSAPFLSGRDSRQRDSLENVEFTRGTQHAESPHDAARDTVSDNVHAQLIVLDGGRHYRLPLSGDRTSWSVGSASEADLMIAQRGVAHDHAIFLKEGNTWTLCDRGTAGGCTVNGHEVNVARIQLGDRLSIGSAKCLFAAADNEQLPKASPSPKPALAPAPTIPEQDQFGEDPLDSPRLRVEIPMDDRIWDEHEQQLYRDTSRDQILRARKNSSRHEAEASTPPPPRTTYASWEPPADYGRARGLSRFLPSAKTTMIAVLAIVALAILGALAYLVI